MDQAELDRKGPYRMLVDAWLASHEPASEDVAGVVKLMMERHGFQAHAEGPLVVVLARAVELMAVPALLGKMKTILPVYEKLVDDTPVETFPQEHREAAELSMAIGFVTDAMSDKVDKGLMAMLRSLLEKIEEARANHAGMHR